MNILRETRYNDSSIRAGMIITDGRYILVEQPTNAIKNGWKLDIPKGHVQNGESPLQGAIREVWEETNIKFEPWKLTRPIQVTCDGSPLYLFYIKLNSLIPVSLLSCVSTFIDKDGIRKPEVEAYYWLNPYTQLHLVQKRLIAGIRYYFNENKREGCQIAGNMMPKLPAFPLSLLLNHRDCPSKASLLSIDEAEPVIPEVKKLRDKIRALLNNTAVPLPVKPFTLENYKSLFPNYQIDTPLGVVKLGEHQFEKLQALGREYLLGAVQQTLNNPTLILFEERNHKKTKLYIKSFIKKDKKKVVQSVVIDEATGLSISVSTHERDLNNVVNKIKTPAQIAYIVD